MYLRDGDIHRKNIGAREIERGAEIEICTLSTHDPWPVSGTMLDTVSMKRECSDLFSFVIQYFAVSPLCATMMAGWLPRDLLKGKLAPRKSALLHGDRRKVTDEM